MKNTKNEEDLINLEFEKYIEEQKHRQRKLISI